jgi:hypothetical protein
MGSGVPAAPPKRPCPANLRPSGSSPSRTGSGPGALEYGRAERPPARVAGIGPHPRAAIAAAAAISSRARRAAAGGRQFRLGDLGRHGGGERRQGLQGGGGGGGGVGGGGGGGRVPALPAADGKMTPSAARSAEGRPGHVHVTRPRPVVTST